MKKVYSILKLTAVISLTAVIMAGFSGFNGNKDSYPLKPQIGNNEIAKQIEEKKQNSNFKDVSLFTLKKDNIIENNLSSFAKEYILLQLKADDLNRILVSKDENIELLIPVSENEFIELELTRVSVLAKDFSVQSINKFGSNNKLYEDGLHYRGIIKGNDQSWAAVSVFKQNIMGLIATEKGNFVLGSIKDNNKNFTENYVLYNDADLSVNSNFKCGIGDMEDKFTPKSLTNRSQESNFPNDNAGVDTVGVYFEADYQMYLDNGSNVQNLVNFITGMFNQVATIYQNEQIPIKIDNIRYWDNTDPYYYLNASDDILFSFGDNTQDNFQGDLAHLLSTGHGDSLGGIAWINVLCTPYDEQYHAGRFAFSNINDSYTPYPTYSWTVMVVAHEMGHNFASRHTHACTWRIPQGGYGALDSCYYSEGNCYTYPEPNYNGTVMSYCHLNGAINLINGFGRGAFFSQPGDTVREGYNLASCIHYETNSSEVPVAYSLLQNYPNPFNPVTSIKYALLEEGYVSLVLYDITGREVARLVDNKFFNAGIYSHIVDANIYGMASGVYLYRIKVSHDSKEAYSEIRKMVLIK